MTNSDQSPLDISNATLMAYLSDDVTAETRRLIERDPVLLARARELGAWEAALTNIYREIRCPAPAELLLYQNQLLDRERSQQIKHHLLTASDCSCAEELAELAALNATPSQRIQRESLWERIRAAGKRVLDAVELIEPQQPALSLRGDEPQRRIIRAGDHLIILLLTPPIIPEDTWEVEGQISYQGKVGPEMEGKAEVYLGDELVASDRIDELGYFTIEGVPAGDTHLLLQTQTTAISPIGLAQ